MKKMLFSLRGLACIAIALSAVMLCGCQTLGASGLDYPPASPTGSQRQAYKEDPPLTAEELDSLTGNERDTMEVFEKYNHAVVNISSMMMRQSWFSRATPEGGTGSGVIIDEKGLIVTNFHVVKDAEKLVVTLYDGSDYEPRVLGIDPENDLALLQINPEGKSLTVVPFGSSKRLRVGQKAIALGNPFGLERTLTGHVLITRHHDLRQVESFG